MTDFRRSRLAQALAGVMSPARAGAMFGAQTMSSPPPTPPVTVRATPPQLPPFQIPGMNTLPDYGQGTPQQQPQSPLPTAAQPQLPPMPPPQAVSTPPGMGGPQPMNQGGLPPLPPSIPIGAAPGMGQPVNGLGASGGSLDEWQRMLDSLQFARQGQ